MTSQVLEKVEQGEGEEEEEGCVGFLVTFAGKIQKNVIVGAKVKFHHDSWDANESQPDFNLSKLRWNCTFVSLK